jgi:fructokinase
MEWFCGVEAGGTKFNCIVANDPKNILEEKRIETTTPDETLPEVVEFFKQIQTKHSIQYKSLGLGSFGPIDLNLSSPNYGRITATPKLVWRNADILGFLQKALAIPAAFDTDVTAAALGEGKWGAAVGCDNFVYLTIGTGIGGGVIVDCKPVHGLLHPEIGHIFVPHDMKVDPFPGNCPSHGDCLEGLANGPAIKSRWGTPAESLPLDHPAWEIEARYLAYCLANLVLTISPKRIILGGGVMKVPGLIDLVRKKVIETLNGYIQSDEIIKHIDRYIQLPGLGDRAGVLGCVALAQMIS